MMQRKQKQWFKPPRKSSVVFPFPSDKKTLSKIITIPVGKTIIIALKRQAVALKNIKYRPKIDWGDPMWDE